MMATAATAAASRLYNYPARPMTFSTLRKLGVAVKKKSNIKLDEVRD